MIPTRLPSSLRTSTISVPSPCRTCGQCFVQHAAPAYSHADGRSRKTRKGSWKVGSGSMVAIDTHQSSSAFVQRGEEATRVVGSVGSAHRTSREGSGIKPYNLREVVSAVAYLVTRSCAMHRLRTFECVLLVRSKDRSFQSIIHFAHKTIFESSVFALITFPFAWQPHLHMEWTYVTRPTEYAVARA